MAVISIAIETSCRCGGIALGRGEELAATIDFDATSRHATQLITRLDELLRGQQLRPADVNEVYVSAGPGSFTGVRVGVTVARTLAQAVAGLRCVRVPTALAVAENARDLKWDHLGVVLDAREGLIHASLFRREEQTIVAASEPAVMTPADFLAAAPRPLLLTGEGLGYHDLTAEGVALADQSLRLPTVTAVWRVGRRMAAAGEFIEYHHLLPLYTRLPKPLRRENSKLEIQNSKTGQ